MLLLQFLSFLIVLLLSLSNPLLFKYVKYFLLLQWLFFCLVLKQHFNFLFIMYIWQKWQWSQLWIFCLQTAFISYFVHFSIPLSLTQVKAPHCFYAVGFYWLMVLCFKIKCISTEMSQQWTQRSTSATHRYSLWYLVIFVIFGVNEVITWSTMQLQ